MSGPSRHKVLLLVCMGAVFARLAVVVLLRSWEHPNAIEHTALAANLLEGGRFAFGSQWGYYGPSSVQAPTYPLILAGLFRLFGTDAPGAYAAAMVLNVFLGGLTVWLTFVLARRLGARPAMAVIAAAMCAVWPTQLYVACHAQAIVLITAAMLMMMIAFDQAVRGGGIVPWLVFSCIGALAALTEPVLLPALVLGGLVMLGRRSLPWAQRLRYAVVLGIATLAVIGPWTIRNRLVHDAWVPIKSTFWVNVWKGNNPHATGTDRVRITEQQLVAIERCSLLEMDALVRDPSFDSARQYSLLSRQETDRLRGKSEIEREAVFRDIALDWMSEHPGRYAQLCGIRLAKTLWIDWDNPKARNIVSVGARSVLLLLVAAGLPAALRHRWRLGYPALILASCIGLYTLTVTAARFSIPLEPLAFCLAAVPIAWCSERIAPPSESAGRLE